MTNEQDYLKREFIMLQNDALFSAFDAISKACKLNNITPEQLVENFNIMQEIRAKKG